ncbi:MAG: M20/M25/M40 family metallo-hydrolase [Planctomycetes bacterium]|nr:M20/M25/M40 family metallo-hydrolase [Planctomycetota bacterium]MCP4862025.1 M20/M25/M40 family metallo-hydrolase [Planctomycetota bacterium]
MLAAAVLVGAAITWWSFRSPITPSAEVADRIQSIGAGRLAEHIKQLTEIGPRDGNDAEATRATLDYISARLRGLGYEPVEEVIDWPGFEGGGSVNLIAEKRGTKYPNKIVEIGAHYDTVPFSPGADDNASGVAGVLEAARVLRDLPTERTIRFCFFGLEEMGLIGSQSHVAGFAKTPEREVLGLLNLEMIACRKTGPDTQDAPIRIPIIASLPTTGDFITVAGDMGSGWLGNLFEACADSYVPELEYFSANRIGGFFGDAARSDHSPYWNSDLPGIMLTDTAEFRNGNYHDPTDIFETLDLEFAAQVSRAAAAAMAHWAGVSGA